MLEVDGITRTYGGLTAVDDVGFSVGAGEIVGVIGPNGAGKTTLFDAITGVDAPDAGSVHLRGEELVGERPNVACRAGVARTFQSVRTFDESTVRENVRAGALFGAGRDRAAAATAVDDALELVGLADDADRHASDLPIAARKRIGLARALATDPEVLLLDEIGSGLTPVEIDALTDTVVRIRDERDVAILWIEHVTDALFAGADRVLVLHDGELIAEGTPAEIRGNERVAEAYLGGGRAESEPTGAAAASKGSVAEPSAATDGIRAAAATDGGGTGGGGTGGDGSTGGGTGGGGSTGNGSTGGGSMDAEDAR